MLVRTARQLLPRGRGFSAKPPVTAKLPPTAPLAGREGGVNPVTLLIIVGGVSAAGFIAASPDGARDALGKLGLRDALEPVIGGIDRATAGIRPQKEAEKAATKGPAKAAVEPKAAAPEAKPAPKEPAAKTDAAAPKDAAPKAAPAEAATASVVPCESKSSEGPSPVGKAIAAADEDLRVQLSTKVAVADCEH